MAKKPVSITGDDVRVYLGRLVEAVGTSTMHVYPSTEQMRVIYTARKALESMRSWDVELQKERAAKPVKPNTTIEPEPEIDDRLARTDLIKGALDFMNELLEPNLAAGTPIEAPSFTIDAAAVPMLKLSSQLVDEYFVTKLWDQKSKSWGR